METLREERTLILMMLMVKRLMYEVVRMVETKTAMKMKVVCTCLRLLQRELLLPNQRRRQLLQLLYQSHHLLNKWIQLKRRKVEIRFIVQQTQA